MLVVVIGTAGSSPREAGAYMLVNAAGRVWGTVGGGVTEYEAQCQAQELLKQKQNMVCQYALLPEANKMCGGIQKMLHHYLDMKSEQGRAAVEALLEKAKGTEAFWLLLPHEKGFLRLEASCSLGEKRCGKLELEGAAYYAEHFNYDGIVYIFGGGHVSQELVPVLSHLDFRCIVVDDREEFAGPGLFPQAVASFKVDYKQLEKSISLKPEDYVCIMTREHTYDAECERFALKSAAYYIGVMGSKFKAKLTREKLLAEGFTENAIKRVITPIGLSIASETPAEIAISIAAQLIKVRAEK